VRKLASIFHCNRPSFKTENMSEKYTVHCERQRLSYLLPKFDIAIACSPNLTNTLVHCQIVLKFDMLVHYRSAEVAELLIFRLVGNGLLNYSGERPAQRRGGG